jgi:hypothetical protein
MIDMLVAPVFAAATLVLQSAPGSDLDPNTVTPGPIGFAAIFLVAAATILLGFDMVRRIRRTTYRAEIKQRLEAEIAAKEDKPE